MSRSRPYPYGTVLRVKEAFAATQRLNEWEHRERRMMVLSDTGEKDSYGITAIPIAGTYDESDIHYPAPDYWEPVDE